MPSAVTVTHVTLTAECWVTHDKVTWRGYMAPYAPPSGILLIGFWVIADYNLCGKHKFMMLAVK